MKTITSRSNPEVQNVVSLHNAKMRRSLGLCIVEGMRAINTFMNAGIRLESLYVTNLSLIPDALHEKAVQVSDSVMEKMSTATTPSGILGVFQIPTHKAALKPGLVLAEISDPGNMGTLIRTAVAMKNPNVVIIGGADCWSPKVIQSSAGEIAQITIFEWTWEKLMEYADENISLCALVLHGGVSPEELPKKERLLIIGNEAHGIPQAWLAQCDEKLTLEMPGKAESLNAAVAGSIALYLLRS